MRRFLMALAFEACTQHVYAYPPGLPSAPGVAEMVWQGCYHRAERVPSVLVVTGDKLTCNHGKGYLRFPVGCIAGENTYGVVQIARPIGAPWHETALTHEFFHRVKGLEGNPTGDINHMTGGWDGQPRSEVDACNRRLEAAGW